MGSDLRTSQNGLKLIMAYEGFRSHSKQLPDGRWMVGYGHTRAARQGVRVSQHEAVAILREFDLPPVEKALNELLLVPVNQNEFDALVSFAFNIGVDQFEGSDVLAFLNAGNRLAAAAAMEVWRKAHVGSREMVVDPLVRRRSEEKALFLQPAGPVPVAASGRFRPVRDIETPITEKTPDIPVKIEEDVQQSAFFSNETQRANETATEAAARNVRERLTRILGEDEVSDDTAADTQDNGEASVDEIRAAISALVNGDEDGKADAAEYSHDIRLEEIDLDGPSNDDDNPAFGFKTGALSVTEGIAPDPRGRLYIDDVSPVEIPPADPDLVADDEDNGPLEAFLYGVLALFGAGLFVYGGAMAFDWFDLGTGSVADPAWLPAFLLLSGGLIFCSMTYYWVRDIIAQD